MTDQLALFDGRERRTKTLNVRVTPTEKDDLAEIAQRRGVSIAEVVRTAIESEIQREEPECR